MFRYTSNHTVQGRVLARFGLTNDACLLVVPKEGERRVTEALAEAELRLRADPERQATGAWNTRVFGKFVLGALLLDDGWRTAGTLVHDGREYSLFSSRCLGHEAAMGLARDLVATREQAPLQLVPSFKDLLVLAAIHHAGSCSTAAEA